MFLIDDGEGSEYSHQKSLYSKRSKGHKIHIKKKRKLNKKAVNFHKQSEHFL